MFRVTKLFQMFKVSVIAALLFGAMFPALGQSNTRLFAAWELWYPYQFNDSKGNLRGVDINFFNAVMQQADISYSIDEIEWKQQLSMLRTGQIDVAMGVSKTPDREGYGYFSIPYRYERVNLFVKTGDVRKYKLANLASIAKTNLKIGTEEGYYYGDEFDRLSDDLAFSGRFHEVVDIEENVRLLLDGKLDGLLADPNTMRAVLNKYNLVGKIEAHPLSIYTTDIHFMFSKKSVPEKTVKLVNDAIEQLKKSGKAESLLGI